MQKCKVNAKDVCVCFPWPNSHSQRGGGGIATTESSQPRRKVDVG